MLDKIDNNTIAIVGLIIIGGMALVLGSPDVTNSVVSGITGFIAGAAATLVASTNKK